MANEVKNKNNKTLSEDKNLVEIAGFHSCKNPIETDTFNVNGYKYLVVRRNRP